MTSDHLARRSNSGKHQSGLHLGANGPERAVRPVRKLDIALGEAWRITRRAGSSPPPPWLYSDIRRLADRVIVAEPDRPAGGRVSPTSLRPGPRPACIRVPLTGAVNASKTIFPANPEKKLPPSRHKARKSPRPLPMPMKTPADRRSHRAFLKRDGRRAALGRRVPLSRCGQRGERRSGGTLSTDFRAFFSTRRSCGLRPFPA